LRIASVFLILYSTPPFDSRTAQAAFFVEVTETTCASVSHTTKKPDLASSEEPPSTNDAFAEWDDPSTIAAVEQALGLFGDVIRLEADQFFPQKLCLARPDLVFNMAEGLSGQSRESTGPRDLRVH